MISVTKGLSLVVLTDIWGVPQDHKVQCFL